MCFIYLRDIIPKYFASFWVIYYCLILSNSTCHSNFPTTTWTYPSTVSVFIFLFLLFLSPYKFDLSRCNICRYTAHVTRKTFINNSLRHIKSYCINKKTVLYLLHCLFYYFLKTY